MPPALDPIETLCALDLGGRGIGRLVVPGAMAAAARSLARARRVVLVTGFVRPAGLGGRDGRAVRHGGPWPGPAAGWGRASRTSLTRRWPRSWRRVFGLSVSRPT